jgi:hypothetical protein
MRLTILQMRVDSESRAANLAHALRLIDRACVAEPSPDLLVLPANCDGHATAEPGSITPAMAQTFAQSIAGKAREWGVYVAAGMARYANDVCVSGAALFDPDGDTVIRTPAPPNARASDDADRTGGDPPGRTPFGRWTLVGGGEAGLSEGEDPPDGTDLIIIPASRIHAAAECVAMRIDDLARDVGACVCVVVEAASPAAPSSRGPVSRIVGRDGLPVADLTGDGEDALSAEIEMASG